MVSPLRKLRRERGMTLMQLANAAGVDFSALSRMERGEQFSPTHAPKLVAYFGEDVIDLDAILGYVLRYRAGEIPADDDDEEGKASAAT